MLGTIIALSFGVGYFLSFGTNFFMLFSLTEHITAALTALPIATICASAVLALGYVESLKNRAIPRAARRLRVHGYKAVLLLGGVALLLTVLFGIVVVLVHSMVGVIGIMLVMVLASAVVAFGLQSRWQTGSRIYMVVAALVMAFLFGLEFGTGIRGSTETPYSLVADEHLHKGMLVYGGEKGLLFYSPETKRTHYFRWDRIKSFSRELPLS